MYAMCTFAAKVSSTFNIKCFCGEHEVMNTAVQSLMPMMMPRDIIHIVTITITPTVVLWSIDTDPLSGTVSEILSLMHMGIII